ncbi:MFS transporter [Streptomyces sp. NPDC102259]|uniref:MFS transporter n=1 Tax=Streptomyces sp. NPDC102259 TaxID=3366148 RepID=UPI0037FF8E01
MTSLRTTGPSSAPTAWTPRMWALLAVLAGNMLIDALEVSVMAVAMPSLGDDLDLRPAITQWMMSGFAIGFGGLLLFGSRVVALLGRRRVYLTALLVFAAASLVAGLVSSPELLVATRVVKGFCAALTAPVGLAIITTAFAEGPDRDRAVSVYTLFGASGFTAGLVLSGLLTQAGWRWTLVFPAPVVVALFAVGLRLIPGDRPDPPRPRVYDVAGAVTFTGSLLALVCGIAAVPDTGRSGTRVVEAFAPAAVLAVAHVLIERTSRAPLLRASLVSNGMLIRSALGAAALNGSYLGLLFVLTFQMQSVLGWGPLRTALALLPASVPLAVTALWSGRMVRRFGVARLIAVGLSLPPLGYGWCLWQSPERPYAIGTLPALVLVGAGFVLAFAALNVSATAGVAPAERGLAGATYQTAVQLGAAVVIAATAACVTADVPAGRRAALALVTGVGLVGAAAGLSGLRPTPAAAPGPTKRSS